MITSESFFVKMKKIVQKVSATAERRKKNFLFDLIKFVLRLGCCNERRQRPMIIIIIIMRMIADN